MRRGAGLIFTLSCRYRKPATFPFPLMSTASLRVVGHECHTLRKLPCILIRKFYIYNTGGTQTHTYIHIHTHLHTWTVSTDKFQALDLCITAIFCQCCWCLDLIPRVSLDWFTWTDQLSKTSVRLTVSRIALLLTATSAQSFKGLRPRNLAYHQEALVLEINSFFAVTSARHPKVISPAHIQCLHWCKNGWAACTDLCLSSSK